MHRVHIWVSNELISTYRLAWGSVFTRGTRFTLYAEKKMESVFVIYTPFFSVRNFLSSYISVSHSYVLKLLFMHIDFFSMISDTWFLKRVLFS